MFFNVSSLCFFNCQDWQLGKIVWRMTHASTPRLIRLLVTSRTAAVTSRGRWAWLNKGPVSVWRLQKKQRSGPTKRWRKVMTAQSHTARMISSAWSLYIRPLHVAEILIDKHSRKILAGLSQLSHSTTLRWHAQQWLSLPRMSSLTHSRQILPPQPSPRSNHY